MKSTKFYVVLLATALCTGLVTSCTGDDDVTPENPQETPQEQGSVNVFNQVKYLQNLHVEIDTLGNIKQRVNGAPLNSIDSTELYIGVADLAEASEKFKSLLSPDTEVKLLVPSTTDLEVKLKDENGRLLETAYFKAVDNTPVLAEVTFQEGDIIKYVSKVIFIKESAWPDNDFSPYMVGDFETYDTFEEGKHSWVCIREAKTGTSGMMMYISKNTYCYDLFTGTDVWASTELAKEASKILRGNWDSYVSFFKRAGRTLDSSFYWTNEYSYGVFYCNQYAIKLSSGDIDWFDILYHTPYKCYIQLRTFGLIQE
ncbi:MAG: hypothetical protein IKJ42_01835 [Bacteroidaceae bacterium]|nr:hypothetical protein [Bacteroidaceae bacterium]